MDEHKVGEVERRAAEAGAAAVAAAHEARALLLKVALRVGVEAADVAIENGLALARIERVEETADGTSWQLQVLYSAGGAMVRLAGSPVGGDVVVGSPENIARVMGTAQGSFDFTLPLDYLRLARAGDVDPLAPQMVGARFDLAERLDDARMELEEGSIPAGVVGLLDDCSAAMRGKLR